MINDIIETLKLYLPNKLKSHHSIYRKACKGDNLEEVVASVLAENGYINDWQPDNNHTISVDMNLENGISLSVKSGTYYSDINTLKISGSRLGKHSNIEDMVNSVIENSADYYICLSRVDQDWSPYPGKNDKKIYYMFVFPSSALRYDSEWITKYSKKGKPSYYMDINGMNAKIESSMSYQLWTWVSTDVIGSPARFDII